MMWNTVATIVQEYKSEVQAILDDDNPDDWSPWFFLPTEGYGEVSNYGPFSLKKLRLLRINPIETKRIGVRSPPKFIDHTESILSALRKGHVPFELEEKLIIIRSID
jgi:hypothetical protein